MIAAPGGQPSETTALQRAGLTRPDAAEAMAWQAALLQEQEAQAHETLAQAPAAPLTVQQVRHVRPTEARSRGLEEGMGAGSLHALQVAQPGAAPHTGCFQARPLLQPAGSAGDCAVTCSRVGHAAGSRNPPDARLALASPPALPQPLGMEAGLLSTVRTLQAAGLARAVPSAPSAPAAARQATEPQPSVRLHVETGPEGLRVWAGIDGDPAVVAARAAVLLAELRRALPAASQRLAHFVCNGTPVHAAAPAIRDLED